MTTFEAYPMTTFEAYPLSRRLSSRVVRTSVASDRVAPVPRGRKPRRLDGDGSKRGFHRGVPRNAVVRVVQNDGRAVDRVEILKRGDRRGRRRRRRARRIDERSRVARTIPPDSTRKKIAYPTRRLHEIVPRRRRRERDGNVRRRVRTCRSIGFSSRHSPGIVTRRLFRVGDGRERDAANDRRAWDDVIRVCFATGSNARRRSRRARERRRRTRGVVRGGVKRVDRTRNSK